MLLFKIVSGTFLIILGSLILINLTLFSLKFVYLVVKVRLSHFESPSTNSSYVYVQFVSFKKVLISGWSNTYLVFLIEIESKLLLVQELETCIIIIDYKESWIHPNLRLRKEHIFLLNVFISFKSWSLWSYSFFSSYI